MIEGNRLRGGMIEFFDGPWRIVDNDFPRHAARHSLALLFSLGMARTTSLIRGNKTRSGRPERQDLALPGLDLCGADDVVQGNTIEQVGARDDDTIPWSNEPEIILTEAYHLKYEGKVMALSDGRPGGADRARHWAIRSGPATWSRC